MMTVVDLNLVEARLEGKPPAFSDEDLAITFAARHTDLRYVAAWGKWLIWRGKVWAVDERLESLARSRKICREMSAKCNDQAQAGRIASAKTVASIERLSRADESLAAGGTQWDVDPWSINTPDGVADLKTSIICEHSPEDYSTKITGDAGRYDGPPDE